MSSDSDCASGSANCHFTCPSGGTWYVCPEAPFFVGCCSSDPCTNDNTTHPCPDTYAASFDGALFDSIRPNTCIDESNDNWFTCNFTEPRFMGCCSINPCANGTCPHENVLPAAWSGSRGDQYALFLDEDDTEEDGGGDSGLSGGAIAGIVVGAVAAIVILLGAWWFWRRRKRGVDGKGGYTAGHGRGPSMGEGSENMYGSNAGAGSEYGYQNPASPYQDSHFSSPGQTVISSGTKYPSGFSPSLSPGLGSEGGRPISEISGSDEHFRQHQRGSANHGLGVFGAKPDPIPELDSTAKPPEVHELDGLSRS
ncbi:hypothetical protein BDW74DRAFT_141971 [Aspergillus multicolor]|uniref:EGFR-like transmembrane domain-containing protein n=1 Tax=Aspergillus multicolor TaxID=41759 RepID=UPI003CCCA9CF